MVQEFKNFLIKGNAVDLAIGFIFGGAFSTVIKSLVNNVVMPPIGQLMKWVDFANLFVALDGKEYATLEAAQTAGAPLILYGQFINDVVSFVILWFVVFMFVRTYNKMKEKEEAAPSGPSELDVLKEIAAALKK